MKTFGRLLIRLISLGVEEFGKRAEDGAGGGWRRDRSQDEEMGARGGNKPWFTFALTGHPSLPTSLLFTTERSGGVLHVPNIISPARSQLSHDEYNAILASFRDDVLAGLESSGAIDVELSGTDVDLSKLLPDAVFTRLKAFSNLANKNTGSGHPFDRERWLDFLIAANGAGVELDSHALGRWLVEEEGWAEEQASRLADQYEFGRELLGRRRAS